MLFSGGVDSLATYIRHQEENPSMIAVHGADIDLENESGWMNVKDSIQGFANTEQVDFLPVRANIQGMLDYDSLFHDFGHIVTGNWWPGVQHGLALLSLSAPLAHLHSASNFYIAASYTDDFSSPWASLPGIDNNVAWSSTTVKHDGYSLSRQDKLDQIASYVQQSRNYPYIRSCAASEAGENCCECEKCARTVIGLEVEGLNPINHGYPITPDAFDRYQECLSKGEWPFGDDELFMWKDIQSALPLDSQPPHDEAAEFCEWLNTQDVDDFYHAAQPPLPVRLLKSALPHLPQPVHMRILKVGKKLGF